MDPQMQARIDEARANGYSDEEIQAYLASQGTPTPAEAASAAGQPVSQYQPIDRSEEYTGLAQGMGTEGALTAAKIAGLGVAGAYGLKKVGEMFRGPVAPTPPTAPGATQRIMSQAMGRPGVIPAGTVPGQPLVDFVQQQGKYAPAQTAQPAPQMQAAKSIVQNLALSKLLPAAQMGAGLFYTSPEEIATLKAAEARRKALGQ